MLLLQTWANSLAFPSHTYTLASWIQLLVGSSLIPFTFPPYLRVLSFWTESVLVLTTDLPCLPRKPSICPLGPPPRSGQRRSPTAGIRRQSGPRDGGRGEGSLCLYTHVLTLYQKEKQKRFNTGRQNLTLKANTKGVALLQHLWQHYVHYRYSTKNINTAINRSRNNNHRNILPLWHVFVFFFTCWGHQSDLQGSPDGILDRSCELGRKEKKS